MMTVTDSMIKGRVTLDDFHQAFDWKVEKRPVYYQNQSTVVSFPGKYTTVRVDNEGGLTYPLGIVQGRYSVIENRRILDVVEQMLGLGAGVPYDFGLKGMGTKFWFRLLFPKYLYPNVTNKNDFLQMCLVVKGTHDGSGSLSAEVQPIRKMCLNGLVWFGETLALTSVRHTSGADVKLENLGRVLRFSFEEFETNGVTLSRLSQTRIQRSDLVRYAETVLRAPDIKDRSSRAQNQVDQVVSLALRGKGNTGETWWDALNGVTEYVDYYRKGNAEERKFSSVANSGAELKREALQLAYTMMEAK